MQFFRIALGAFALMLTAAAEPPKPSGRSVNIPVEKLDFYRNKYGMMVANAWGDPAKGPHSNYIRLPANTSSPVHTHSYSYYGVVIEGVVSNERRPGHDRSLRAGSYWEQRGGEPHVTSCRSASDCLIFVTSRGTFDFHIVPARRGSEIHGRRRRGA